MALVKFDRGLYRNGNTAKGLNYGQIEPNQVWFNRAGMVEAQCALDTACFSDVQVNPLAKYAGPLTPGGEAAQKIVAQNGAFLQVNKATYTATIPTQAGATAGMPVGINYSTEKLYDDFHKARRNFFLTTQDWLPRIGYVERGMRITTNTVQWDSEAVVEGAQMNLNFANYMNTADSYAVFYQVQRFLEDPLGAPIYAAVIDGSDGELVITGTKPANYIILAQVVAAYDNADRTCSFMFQILDGGTK